MWPARRTSNTLRFFVAVSVAFPIGAIRPLGWWVRQLSVRAGKRDQTVCCVNKGSKPWSAEKKWCLGRQLKAYEAKDEWECRIFDTFYGYLNCEQMRSTSHIDAFQKLKETFQEVFNDYLLKNGVDSTGKNGRAFAVFKEKFFEHKFCTFSECCGRAKGLEEERRLKEDSLKQKLKKHINEKAEAAAENERRRKEEEEGTKEEEEGTKKDEKVQLKAEVEALRTEEASMQAEVEKLREEQANIIKSIRNLKTPFEAIMKEIKEVQPNTVE